MLTMPKFIQHFPAVLVHDGIVYEGMVPWHRRHVLLGSDSPNCGWYFRSCSVHLYWFVFRYSGSFSIILIIFKRRLHNS